MWSVIDEVLLGNEVNEDSWGASGPLAWIMDGSSSVSPERIAPRWASDARWLVERLESSLRELSTHSELSLQAILGSAIESVSESAQVDWDHEPDVPPSAAIGLVRKLDRGLEYLVLADVSVVVHDEEGFVEVTDQRVDDGNVEAFEALKQGLVRHTPLAEVRNQIAPLLHDYRRVAMNRPGGYYVVSIDPLVASEGIEGSNPTANEVVLATDGFMRCIRPFGFLGQLSELVDHPGALPDIAMRVREKEREDPDAQSFPRWNMSDDLCAVRLRWAAQ